MKKKAWEDTITTIQVSKKTRDFLRKVAVHADKSCYEHLFVDVILPLIREKAKTDDPAAIGEMFKQKEEK